MHDAAAGEPMTRTRRRVAWALVGLGIVLVTFSFLRLGVIPVKAEPLGGATFACPMPLHALVTLWRTGGRSTGYCSGPSNAALLQSAIAGVLGLMALVAFVAVALRHTWVDLTDAPGAGDATLDVS